MANMDSFDAQAHINALIHMRKILGAEILADV
jgi:hypothetical protein